MKIRGFTALCLGIGLCLASWLVGDPDVVAEDASIVEAQDAGAPREEAPLVSLVPDRPTTQALTERITRARALARALDARARSADPEAAPDPGDCLMREIARADTLIERLRVQAEATRLAGEDGIDRSPALVEELLAVSRALEACSREAEHALDVGQPHP
jgi:hypothetical protein